MQHSFPGVLELPPPKMSFGAVPAASSWFKVSIWAHLAFLVEGSHSLERIWNFLHDFFSLERGLPLGKPSVNPTPPDRGSWHGASAAPGMHWWVQALCILAPQGSCRHHSCTLAGIADHCVRQDWPCPPDPPLGNRNWSGSPKPDPSLGLQHGPEQCSISRLVSACCK